MPTREHTKGTTRIGVEYGVVAVKKQTRYFSITVAGAPQHELVLKLWPDLAPLVALHLSDVDGAPHSAEANGWYWLAGACGGLGEEVHGANGDPNTLYFTDGIDGETHGLFGAIESVPLMGASTLTHHSDMLLV
jgi:hypothetical protein